MERLQSILVQDYMQESLITLSPETHILDAVSSLLQCGISAAPVVDKRGHILGMLSEKDCMRVAINAAYHGELGGCVGQFMSKDVETVDAETSVIEVAERFARSSYRCFPVMKDNRLVGLFMPRDVLKAIEHMRSLPSLA